jgi:hypothetical protein
LAVDEFEEKLLVLPTPEELLGDAELVPDAVEPQGRLFMPFWLFAEEGVLMVPLELELVPALVDVPVAAPDAPVPAAPPALPPPD